MQEDLWSSALCSLRSPAPLSKDGHTQREVSIKKGWVALLGSGMHGKNGISRAKTYQMWIAFVIPRLLHGKELLNIRKTDVEKLEIYQRKVLKQLQILPLNTPSVAVLYLLGAKKLKRISTQRSFLLFWILQKIQTPWNTSLPYAN